MAGDPLLFARQDEVENAWRIVEPALKSPPPLESYEPGSVGTRFGRTARRAVRRLARAGHVALLMTPAAKSQQAGNTRESRTLLRLPDAEDVARTAARLVAEIRAKRRASAAASALALAGGDTPRRLYERLAADAAIDWSRTELFCGDERPVPPEHPDSNYGMARERCSAPLGIDPKRVHRIEAERADLDAVARDYATRARARLGGGPREALPRLDLVLLGLGADGHTASLFPHTRALAETRRAVVANDVPQLGTRRDHDHVSADRARARACSCS